jgi:hypothetical protein
VTAVSLIEVLDPSIAWLDDVHEDAAPCRRCEAILLIQAYVRRVTSQPVTTPELADRLDRAVLAARVVSLMDDEPTLH